MKEATLNGAWEEKGVIGKRIEIKNSHIIVLWRNSSVLDTKFQLVEGEDGKELRLEKNGLRYEGSASDYASITKLTYQEEKLVLLENFPITGESKTILSKTKNSRYGDYTIVDEKLKELEGEWTDEDGTYSFRFHKDTLMFHDQKVRVHVLHVNGIDISEECYRIVDQDPSHYELFGFISLDYIDGKVFVTEFICDAPPHKVELKKL